MATIHEMQIDAHKLVALSFNPDQPGLPIILLHGICSSVHYWNQDLFSLFLEHGPCYALSLPGHFPAIVSPGFKQKPITPEMIAHLLTAAIRKLVGNQPVMLAGHSTGGFAALNIAAHYPNLARYIVSISGFAQGEWKGVFGAYQGFARSGFPGNLLFKLGFKLNLNIRAMHRASLRFFTANSRQFFAHPNLEGAIDTYLPYAKQLDLEAMMIYFAAMPKIDISHLLSRISAPTLALAGDSDPIVPPTQSRLIAEKVPRGNLALLKGAGHLPFFEYPAEYQKTLRQWLQRQVS